MSNPESFRGYPDLDSVDELRLEHLVDTAGFPYYVAYKAVTGVDPEQSPDPQPRVSPESRQPHVSHRGGRSYPEPSDSALDPYWNQRPEPLNNEELAAQQLINDEGRQLVEQRVLPAQIERTRRDAEEWGIPFEALLRARNARRQRRNV